MNKFAMLLPAMLCFVQIAKAEKVLIQPGEVGQISNSALPHPTIVGSFMLKADPDGAEDKRIGGACLVFQPVGNIRSCSTNANCMPKSTSPSGQGANVPAGWYGYCDSTMPRHASCWYRPGPQGDYCNVGKTLKLNEKMRVPVGFVDIYPVHTGRRPVRWRVITCQNLAGKCKEESAVEGVDKRTIYGKARTFAP